MIMYNNFFSKAETWKVKILSLKLMEIIFHVEKLHDW